MEITLCVYVYGYLILASLAVLSERLARARARVTVQHVPPTHLVALVPAGGPSLGPPRRTVLRCSRVCFHGLQGKAAGNLQFHSLLGELLPNVKQKAAGLVDRFSVHVKLGCRNGKVL